MVTSETNKNVYVCDGIQTVFPITFDVAFDDYGNAEGVAVSLQDPVGTVTVLTKETHYTISGKNITTVATYEADYKIAIYRKNAILQQIGFVKNGKADLDVLEKLLDRIIFHIQEHEEKLGRTFLAPVTESLIENINEALQALINENPDSFLTTLGITSFIKTLLDDETASAALSTLGLTAYAKTLIAAASAGDAQTVLGVSAFIKTLLDDADAAAARGTLGVIDSVYPVGSFYVQYPDASSNDAATAFPSAKSPATLFGGTWALQYDSEGIVFQTEGYDGAGRTNGLMEDQMQLLTGEMTPRTVTAVGQLHDAGYLATGVFKQGPNSYSNYLSGGGGASHSLSFDSSGSPDARTGTRTAHRNRLMRVYKRTA